MFHAFPVKLATFFFFFLVLEGNQLKLKITMERIIHLKTANDGHGNG